MSILVVGGGKMGMSHLALISQYVGKNQVALCDSKWITRRVFQYLGYKTFASIDAAHEGLERIDGVLIATPTQAHAPLARWAIARKIPFFVEKPLTLDAAQSRELVAQTNASGTPAQMGFVLRYVASFSRLQALVAEGKLGSVNGYLAVMRGNVVNKPLAEDDWRGDFRLGGGCLNEYGPHVIDLCRFIFGPVASIEDATQGRSFSTHADDRFSVRWRHDTGLEGCVEADWSDASKRKSVIEFQVDFEHARVRVDNSAIEVEWHPDAPVSPETQAGLEMPPRSPNVGFYLRGEEFSLEIEDFLTLCLKRNFHSDPALHNNKAPDLTDGSEVDALIDVIAEKAGLK